jgi:hypothetical protein
MKGGVLIIAGHLREFFGTLRHYHRTINTRYDILQKTLKFFGCCDECPTDNSTEWHL